MPASSDVASEIHQGIGGGNLRPILLYPEEPAGDL